jgi:hypothetical protein
MPTGRLLPLPEDGGDALATRCAESIDWMCVGDQLLEDGGDALCRKAAMDSLAQVSGAREGNDGRRPREPASPSTRRTASRR